MAIEVGSSVTSKFGGGGEFLGAGIGCEGLVGVWMGAGASFGALCGVGLVLMAMVRR